MFKTFGTGNPFITGDEYKLLWNTVGKKNLMECWYQHLVESAVETQCRSFILQKLGTDIEFRKGSSKKEPEGMFKSLVENEWSKFIRDAYDCYQVMGVIPIEFIRTRGEKSDFVPVVPPPGTYIIQVAYVKGGRLGKRIYRVLVPRKYFFSKYENIEDGGVPPLRPGIKRIIRDRHRKTRTSDGTYNWNNIGVGTTNDFCTMGNPQLNENEYTDYKDFFIGAIPSNYVLDRNILVLDGFGYDPLPTGELTTKLGALYGDRKFTGLFATILISNQIRLLTFPEMLERDEEDVKTKEALLQGFRNTPGEYVKKDIHVPSNGHNIGKDPHKYIRSQEQLEAIIEMIQHYRGTFLNASTVKNMDKMAHLDPTRNMLEQAMSLIQDTYTPIVELPKGVKLSNANKKESTLGHDYFNLLVELEEKTTAAYGIPLPLLRNNGAYRGNVEDMQKFLNDTIVEISRMMSTVLTECYDMIYGWDDMEHHLSIAEILERPTSMFELDVLRAKMDEDWVTSNGQITKRKIDANEFVRPFYNSRETDVYISEDEDTDEEEDEKLQEKERSVKSMADDEDEEREKELELLREKNARENKIIDEAEKEENSISDQEKLKRQADHATIINKGEHLQENEDAKNKKSKGNKKSSSSSSSLKTKNIQSLKQQWHRTSEEERLKSVIPDSDSSSSSKSGNKDKGKGKKNASLNRAKTALKKKFISNYRKMTVSLVSVKNTGLELIKEAYDNGAILKKEFIGITRHQLGLEFDDNIMNELIKEQEEEENKEIEQARKMKIATGGENGGKPGGGSTGSSSSSSSSSSGGKKPNKKESKLGGRLKTRGLSEGSDNKRKRKQAKTQGEASSSEHRKRQKASDPRSRIKSNAADIKRSASASANKSQKFNKKIGAKQGYKSTTSKKRPNKFDKK